MQELSAVATLKEKKCTVSGTKLSRLEKENMAVCAIDMAARMMLSLQGAFVHLFKTFGVKLVVRKSRASFHWYNH